jgi:anti-sigma B factor antagonist
VETAIGVFASRDGAEDAVKSLVRQQVPEQSIVFLTRPEGAGVEANGGGDAERPAGLAATLMSVPGIGQVLALGFGAAALLGMAGTGAEPTTPTPEEKCSDDIAFFREVLQEGRSVVVVRTESPEVAKKAGCTLDRLGLGLRPLSPPKIQCARRQVGEVSVVEISGRITQGEGSVMLRQIVNELLDKESKKILLHLGEVHYIDSSGMGELVRIYTSVRNQGGELKLVSPSKRVQDLLEMTRLNAVFRIDDSESAAIASCGG